MSEIPASSDLREFRGPTRLFPLGGLVMFPHVLLPLHIFEPRYRQMTEDALADDRLVTIVKPRASVGGVLGGQEPAIEPVGCLGRIVQHERLPDGRFHLLLLGCERVRLTEELDRRTLYRWAAAEVLGEDAEPEAWSPAAWGELVACVDALSGEHPELREVVRREIGLGAMCDLLAHGLPLPLTVKQELLETCDPGARSTRLLAELRGVVAKFDGGRKPSRRYPPPVNLN